MWDKETSKTKKPEDTSVEGNTENAAPKYFKRNNLSENVSAGTDTVVVTTFVVHEDDDRADNRRNVTDRPKPLSTEQNDINQLLSIVQLCDGPSTSSFSQKNELTNKVPLSTKLSDLKSVLPTSVASHQTSNAANEPSNAEELTVSVYNDELPYKNTNENIKSQSSVQFNKPVLSVKYISPISRKSAQKEKLPEERSKNIKNIQSDNVAGPQMQSLCDKPLTLSEENLDTTTREYSPAGSVEDLTSVSEIRVCSPTPSSITSASTLRVGRGSSGRRTECLRHMRRPPKEPEEYLDALFPHIRKAHKQIRQALLHAPVTDVKDNALLKKKMLELIQIYTSGCKDEFERVGPSLVLCRRLKRNIIRLLDLFHEICTYIREDHVYLYHISQLIAVYTSLEIRLSFNLTRLQKCALIHRISHIIHKHLMIKNESLAKENILRMFLHMPDTYSARFIMEPLFNTFLQEIPTSSNTWCQKELTDKVFVQYIIILYIWKEMLRDPLEQVELINQAQHFMCPTKMLHANPMYANHLPTIHTRKHAVKDILNSLKFFHDLRNAAICDDTLHDGDDDIEVVIDEVINTPFWDFGAAYTGELKKQRNLNRRILTTDPIECVDLTQEDDQQSIFDLADKPLEWLIKLKENAAEKVQVDESEKVICLDSDSDGELFSGSILDPSESYQDCDAVDTDYTSLDGSTTDDKDLSDDEVMSGNGITPSGLRTYLAPRSKNQINVINDKPSTTCPPSVSDIYERTRDCDGEGDNATVGTKKSTVASVTSAEPTLPLIVNSFTVRGKQNIHLLNSPRFSLDIGPERLGNEDIEFHDTCDEEREISLNYKATKNHFKRADSAVVNDHAAGASAGDCYQKELNIDVEEEDDEYHSLPSTASSSTTTLGKVIYSQALLRPSQQFLAEYVEREGNYNRTDCQEKTFVDNERIKEDNKKQMLIIGDEKPMKKQVKFNDNPIGPTRRPHTKLPIKPAIHLSKIQPSNQQPIFTNSPQPRFSSPSSSTSSTTESLKQMAQKGRNFVNIIKTHKSKKIAKSSSAIIIDSDDDDIIDINTVANKKTNLVSTQPIQSKNTYKGGITNEHLSICNNICKNRMCKMQACDVSNSTTMILGPKDISSTNNIRNKSVDIMHISDDQGRDNTVSIVCNNVGVLEVEKQIEREEQNSNVSTTTGPNVDSNTEVENRRGLVIKNCSQKQTNANVESTREEEDYSTHSLEVIIGSDICTSTSSEAFVQNTDCSVHNFEQFSSTTESVKVVESVLLMANSIGDKDLITGETIADKRMDVDTELNKSVIHVNDITNDNISKKIICEDKSDLDDNVLPQCLDSQCTNKNADKSVHRPEDSKSKELNKDETNLSEKLQSKIVLVPCKEISDSVNENFLENNCDGAGKNISSLEKINEEKNSTHSVTPETFTEIKESCNNQSKEKEPGDTSDISEPSLDKSLQETEFSSQVASNKLALQMTEISENVAQTTHIIKNFVAKSDVIPTSNVTGKECHVLTEEQEIEELFLNNNSDNSSDLNIIITDNTITLSQQCGNEMIEKIATSIEELDEQERATHTVGENAVKMDVDAGGEANEMSEINADTTNINIDKPTSREITSTPHKSTAYLNENKFEFKVTNTETEQNINFNIDLENISKDKVGKEKTTSNQIEPSEYLETDPYNSDAKISTDQTEPKEVPLEIFKPTIATNDGLACLVAAVKSVEALTFTTQISKYIVPIERGRNETETRDENKTSDDVENLLTSELKLKVSSDTLVTQKTNENVTEKSINLLKNSIGKIDTCILVKSKATESNNIYFSGDKSPKTNLERLAEAAAQKYGEHAADREAENVENKSREMSKPQTDIIDGTDSANAELYRDINKISEGETSPIESSNVELNSVKLPADELQITCREQLKSTAVIIENIQISQPTDYDKHIFNLSDNVQSIQDSACYFKQEDIFKSSAGTQESGNFDNNSKLEKTNCSVECAPLKTSSTFYSHFESFISTLKGKQGTKCEVKEQRRSPRTQKSYTASKISSTSENGKSVASNTKVSPYTRHNTVKKLLSKNDTDLVISNKVSTKSLTQHSPSLSGPSDSELSNVGVGEVELRKIYGLRKREQWKVVKNTSLRASPSANNAECMDTKKNVNSTLSKRCIKIRLARAKVPPMAEKKEQPISSEQTEVNIESEFGDVSHRPITRRLAAALNSSLQMVTENAVIEPIKPFAHGRKSKSKMYATLAENTPMKRRKCENVAKILRQNEKEPPDDSTILPNRHIGNIETISDDCTTFPEQCSAKRMKLEIRKNVMKKNESETVTTMQNTESGTFAFETVFVKPNRAIKNLKPAKLSSTEAITLQQQPIAESETLITINNEYPIHNEDVLHENSTVEAAIQKAKIEGDKIQEKTKTKVLSTKCTSENSIEGKRVQLTEEQALANFGKLSVPLSVVKLSVEDPTWCKDQGSDEFFDNRTKPDNEKSEGVLNQKSCLTQNKAEVAESEKSINKSCIETSVYIRESVFKTQDDITTHSKSSYTSEDLDANVLGLDENVKKCCIKTIDSEKPKVERRKGASLSVLEEVIYKDNTEKEVFIRDSVSNTQENVKHFNKSSSTCDSKETSALVLDKTLTTEASTRNLKEDINRNCAETGIDIGESVLKTQDGLTLLHESSSTGDSEETSVLNLNEGTKSNCITTSDSVKSIKAERRAETSTPILEEIMNKQNTERNTFIEQSVYSRQGGVTHLDESSSKGDSKETSALLLHEEFMKTRDSMKSLTTETSMRVLEENISKSCTETRNELETKQPSTKQILLTNDLESTPISFHEDSDILPENNEALPLVDISNFTSLTLDTKSVGNFRDVSEFLNEEPNINLNTSHIPVTDKSEYLNETDAINTLKTNMEADKLLEEYNHSARIIANANLKIPPAIHTPTEGCTPACSSVTFSFTASDSSSSFTNSCSCSTTSTVNSVTDLCKNELTSFKVVQSQTQVVELLSSTSTSFQDLPLLDLEHDVIMSNDDLLSELIPTSMMDTMAATSLEHNYAIKPLETAIRNEYDIQSEANENTEELLNPNNETPLQVPSLKVSIPIAYIKRFEEITDNRSKNWYLSEKPSTSKAALAALARRNAQFKTDTVHIFNTTSVSTNRQIPEPTFSESVENKQDVASTDNSGSHQLLAADSYSPSPSLPLKKRRNISGVLEEDFSNVTVIMSDDSDLVTMISQNSNSIESIKLSDMTTETDGKGQIEFNNTKKVETEIARQTTADNNDTSKSTNEVMPSRKTDFEDNATMETTIHQQIIKENEQSNANESEVYIHTNEISHTTNEKTFNNRNDLENSNNSETIAAEQQITKELPKSQHKTNDKIMHTREDIDSDIEKKPMSSSEHNTGVKDEDVFRDKDLLRDPQKEVMIHLGTNLNAFNETTLQVKQQDLNSNGISSIAQNMTDERVLGEEQNVPAINIASPNAQNITDEKAIQEEQNDRAINNTLPEAQNVTDETVLLGDQQDMVPYKTETDGAVTNIQFQETIERNETEEVANEHQIRDRIIATSQEQLDGIELTPVQRVLVPDHQGLTLKDDCHTEHTRDGSRSIAVLEIQEKDIQDLMNIQQIHRNDNILGNFNDHANEVILSSYEDQFLVTVCLNDSETVSGFEATNNIFSSKEYAENDFDIGNDVIISTQEIKEESMEFISNFNSPKNSPINLIKPLPVSANTYDLNTPLLNQNEFVEFTSDSPHALAPTNSTNFTLFGTTIPNSEIVNTDLNVNNIPPFTNCELNMDQEDPSDRKSIIDLAQMAELNFGDPETIQATQLPRVGDQMDQLEYNNFAESQIHTASTEKRNTDAFVGATSPLKVSSNTAVTKPTQTIEMVRETQATATSTIKICSTNKSKQSLESNEIIAMPAFLAQSQNLAKPSTLSPILPLIKPTTTTISAVYDKSNAVFSFPDIEPACPTLSQNSVTTDAFPITTAAGLADNCATTSPTNDDDKSLSTFPSQSSMSQTQTQTTRSNTSRGRAPTRVQIVTPQRKNREISAKTSGEEKPNIIFTNTTTSFCSSVEFDMNEVAATIPVSYPTTPAHYANLFQFEKYIQKLMTLIDVPGIIDSARNLFVDKQALAEAHAALLAQATQFDDEGNAISEPLLLKYHKDGTISILNDNDECIILTANMSKMVQRLSLALSILQEQQSPVLGIRARIHALLKQLTQTSTTKTTHVAPNIINSSVIPTAVVNPTNLLDSSRDIDINASNIMEYCSDIGEEVSQQTQPPHQVINTNFQNLQLYAANWQNIEDSGLITSLQNSELQIVNKEQLIDIDALQFPTVEGATNYEHAVTYNFDDHATMLSTNENTNAQRFENAFHATLERSGGRNCSEGEQNSHVNWLHERPHSKVSPEASHPLSCTDVIYDQNVTHRHENVTTGHIDVNNDHLHTVMINNRDDTLIDSYSMASNKEHAIAPVGSNLAATVSKKGEKSKKTVYRTSDNYQLEHTQRHEKPPAHCSTKKLTTKRVEKVPKAQSSMLPTSAAVTPQQHTQNTSNSKIRSMQHSNTPVHRHTSTIHYRHNPQSMTANVEYKPSATLHYRQTTPRQQQQPQPQRISSLQVPTHFVANNANHAQQPLPHLDIDSVSNLPLFTQQYPQNSALSGGVGLLHNNNIRYLLTPSHTRTRFTSTSTTLSNSDITSQNVMAESQEKLGQYPYQLQALQTQSNISDNMKLNELELQSLIKNATHPEVIASRGTIADTTATATTTNVLRSFRNPVRATNALPKTDATPTFMLNSDTQISGEESLLTIQQQQQQQQQYTQQQPVQFLQPVSAIIIGNIQQKQEAEIDRLRQELAKQETQLQTTLQLPLVQQQSPGQLKVDRSQRMYTTITPISPSQAKHQHSEEREHAQTQAITPQRQHPQTLSTIVKPSHTNAPTPPSIPANNLLNRKRGRPRKYNFGDDNLLATSDLLQKHTTCDAAQKYAKLSDSLKIRPNAAETPIASGRNKLSVHKPTNAKMRQILPTAHYTLTNQSHESALTQRTPILPPPPPLTKSSSSCTPQELRPSFTSSANAFHLIEHMVNAVESGSCQNVKAAAKVCQQQQQQQESLHHMHPMQTTRDSQLDQANV